MSAATRQACGSARPAAPPCRRRALRALALVGLLLAAAAPGCIDPGYPYASPVGDLMGATTIHDLALRLDMEIVEAGETGATLRRGSDTVTIFPEPGGQVYVNARPLTNAGQILAVDGALFLPGGLAERIASALPARAALPAQAGRQSPEADGGGSPVGATVVIDPGHGGRDPGTTVAERNFGIRLHEKTVNLAVSLTVAKLLKQRGVNVVLTRSSDQYVSLDRRVAIANGSRASLFVSIHADSCPDRSVSGFLVLVPSSLPRRAVAAARAVEGRLTALGLTSRGVRRDSRGLRVLRKTTCPAILVEMGFLSNRQDATRLAKPAQRQRIAQAIADAIVEFLAR